MALRSRRCRPTCATSRASTRRHSIIVHQPYSLNFVPEADVVFGEVARVLRPGGRYYLHCANPFFSGIGTRDWNGEGYTLRHP